MVSVGTEVYLNDVLVFPLLTFSRYRLDFDDETCEILVLTH